MPTSQAACTSRPSALIGDAKPILKRLLEVLPAHNARRASRKPEMESRQAVWRKRLGDTIGPQLAFLDAIRAELPEDGILVDEVTQMGFAARLAFPVTKPRTFLSPGYQDNLGWGFATALGAQDARRDVPVVSISGDGGFMFTANEMATAVRHRIPLTTIVFNDGAFGNVRRIQQEKYRQPADRQRPRQSGFREIRRKLWRRRRAGPLAGGASRCATAGVQPPRRADADRGSGGGLPVALAVYLHAAGVRPVNPGDISLGAAILSPLCKPGMDLITTTEELATTCERLAQPPLRHHRHRVPPRDHLLPAALRGAVGVERRGRGDRRAWRRASTSSRSSN